MTLDDRLVVGCCLRVATTIEHVVAIDIDGAYPYGRGHLDIGGKGLSGGLAVCVVISAELAVLRVEASESEVETVLGTGRAEGVVAPCILGD